MSLQPQPTIPQAPHTPIEVSWDDAIDGKFPPTRQHRLQQAVTQAAEQVFTQPAVQANPERLHKAMDLVLTRIGKSKAFYRRPFRSDGSGLYIPITRVQDGETHAARRCPSDCGCLAITGRLVE